VSFPASADNGGGEVTKYKVQWIPMGESGYNSFIAQNKGELAADNVLYSEYDIQTITATAKGRGLAGTFRVAFRGHITPAISAEVTADELKKQLEKLPTVGRIGVTRRQFGNNDLERQGYVWTIHCYTYLGDDTSIDELLVSTNTADLANSFGLTQLGGAGTTLQGTDCKIEVKTIVRALAGFEVQTIQTGITGGTGKISGTFTLIFDGKSTKQLKYDSSAEDVRVALESIGTGALKVMRRVRQVNVNDGGYVWTVVFKEKLGNVPGLCPTEGEMAQCKRGLVSSNAQKPYMLMTDAETAPGTEGKLPVTSPTPRTWKEVEATTDATITTVIDGLERGTPYHVRVSAWNGVGNMFGKYMYSTPALQAPAELPEPPV